MYVILLCLYGIHMYIICYVCNIALPIWYTYVYNMLDDLRVSFVQCHSLEHVLFIKVTEVQH